MKRLFSFPAAAVVTSLVLIGFSAVALYPVWVGVLLFWFGSLFVQYRNGTPELPAKLRVFHQVSALAFPIAATALKWYLFARELGSDVGFGNRIQHFSWALCTVGLFAPMLRHLMVQRDLLQRMMIIVGFVSMLGNFNEIAEWRRGSMQYSDTMKDLTMNIAGAVLGGLIVVALERRRHPEPLRFPRQF
jgi:hypothetical protein